MPATVYDENAQSNFRAQAKLNNKTRHPFNCVNCKKKKKGFVKD